MLCPPDVIVTPSLTLHTHINILSSDSVNGTTYLTFGVTPNAHHEPFRHLKNKETKKQTKKQCILKSINVKAAFIMS